MYRVSQYPYKISKDNCSVAKLSHRSKCLTLGTLEHSTFRFMPFCAIPCLYCSQNSRTGLWTKSVIEMTV